MNKQLQLIQIHIKNTWYWIIDERYSDDSGGVFAESIEYETDKKAIKALLENDIEWDFKDIVVR